MPLVNKICDHVTHCILFGLKNLDVVPFTHIPDVLGMCFGQEHLYVILFPHIPDVLGMQLSTLI